MVMTQLVVVLRLKAERILRGLSQVKLARAVGISGPEVSRIESGHSRPYPSQVEKAHRLPWPHRGRAAPRSRAGDPGEGRMKLRLLKCLLPVTAAAASLFRCRPVDSGVLDAARRRTDQIFGVDPSRGDDETAIATHEEDLDGRRKLMHIERHPTEAR